MGKFLILLLDLLIALAVIWFFVFSDYFSFYQLLTALFGLVIAVGCWAYIAKRKDQAEAAIALKEERTKVARAAEEARELAAKEHARQEQLAAEHEARRPVCTHCGKKTSSTFRHRRIDGSPDMRYHDNPMLCNQCLQPYSPVRPWKLPKNLSPE